MNQPHSDSNLGLRTFSNERNSYICNKCCEGGLVTRRRLSKNNNRGSIEWKLIKASNCRQINQTWWGGSRPRLNEIHNGAKVILITEQVLGSTFIIGLSFLFHCGSLSLQVRHTRQISTRHALKSHTECNCGVGQDARICSVRQLLYQCTFLSQVNARPTCSQVPQLFFRDIY